MIVRQVPDEIGHDAADDDAREELDAADSVEGEAGVVRRGRLGTAVEGVEHGVCMFRMYMCVCFFRGVPNRRRVRVRRRWTGIVVGRAR